MFKQKKYSLLVLGLLLATGSALAQGPLDPSLSTEILGQAEQTARLSAMVTSGAALDPRILIARIIAAALGLVSLIFVIRIIYAGVMWFSAQGNPETIKKAQKIIFQSTIGAVVLLSSYGVAKFVQTSFTKALEGNMLDSLNSCSGSNGPCCTEWNAYENAKADMGENRSDVRTQNAFNAWQACKNR